MAKDVESKTLLSPLFKEEHRIVDGEPLNEKTCLQGKQDSRMPATCDEQPGSSVCRRCLTNRRCLLTVGLVTFHLACASGQFLTKRLLLISA